MTSPLIRYLREGHQAVAGFSDLEWSLLLRDAERNKLLSTVACRIMDAGGTFDLPEKIRRKLDSAAKVAVGSARSVRWEVDKIERALGEAQIPFVLLKGAAYEMLGLPAARGRLFVDVDIMVRRDVLERAERALLDHDWISSKLDSYDQRYYRKWMHEIPPMRHVTRNTSLDVHHTILPPTAVFKPDVDLLWADAEGLPAHHWVYRLADRDMVLHSAVHLFHDGDLAGGLRDLVDLDLLITQFGEDGDFWLALLDRAKELDLIRPCYYALKYCRQILSTAIPDWVLARAEVLGAPHPILELGMDALVGAALEPSRETVDARWSRFGRWLLHVRSHYLRMPLYLLVPHLARKAVKPYS